MDNGQMRNVLACARQAVRPAVNHADDRLLENFVRGRDEAAFAELLRRHGPMVLGVCQRILANSHDAEDAFQTTFLVLVRKAATIRNSRTLRGWLHRVACRAALQACRAKRSRPICDVQQNGIREPAGLSLEEWEILSLLDRELDRLPARFRTAVILCDLEGRTRREAAGLLGVPEGTLSGRLTTAHRLLAKRLARFGICATSAALTSALASQATAALPLPLFQTTVRAGVVFAAGLVTEIPAPVASLTKGVLHAMFLRKLRFAALAFIALMICGIGLGVALEAPAHNGPSAEPSQPPVAARLVASPEPPQPAEPPPAKPRPALRTLTEQHSSVRVAYGKDGTLATFSDDHSVILRDGRTGTVRHHLVGHQGLVIAGAFSPDGKTLATTDATTVRLWQVETGKPLQTLAGPLADVHQLAHSPDGKTLASIGGRGLIRLWDLAGEKVIRSFSAAHPEKAPIIIFAITYSPDGKYLAAATTDGHPGPSHLRLWEVETGRLHRTLIDGAKWDVWAVTFSPDGKLLAAGNGKGDVTLFETKAWQNVGMLEGQDQLRSLAFSPDNRMIAMGVRKDVQLWDAATGKRLRTLVGHGNWVLSLAFAPDGQTLASGSSDQTVKLWALDQE